MSIEQHRPAVIVWGSGSGTTFRAIAEALRDGLVDFDIPLVITDKDDAGILDQVAEVNSWGGRDSHIETMVINRQHYPDGPQPRGQTLAEAETTCEVLRRHGDAVLLLAGCMRILGDPVLAEFGWQPEWASETLRGAYKTRIINTHPGPVPETADLYGVGPSRWVIEAGLPQTAQTLLAVGGPIDGGPVIAAHWVDVPQYRWEDAASEEAAAQHLFTQVVQPIEKAHLPLDVADFVWMRNFMP